MSPEYRLTVICVTCNHGRFIGQALEGFALQETKFPFQVRVAEDCSDDNTAEIIRDYAARYPEIISPVFREKRYGVHCNGYELAEKLDTEYVAYCEGDDYWTSPDKLQRQVDFLDAHPECSMCFHPARIVYEDGSRPDTFIPAPAVWRDGRFTFKRLLHSVFLHTSSVVFRWRFNQKPVTVYKELRPQGILPGDWYLHLLHAQIGEIGFIPETMSVYRRHEGGLWWKKDRHDFNLRNGLAFLNFETAVEKQFGVSRERQFAVRLKDILESGLIRERFDVIEEVFAKYPERAERYLPPALAGTLRILTASRDFERWPKILERLPRLGLEVQKAAELSPAQIKENFMEAVRSGGGRAGGAYGS